jgi:hypothetical protein
VRRMPWTVGLALGSLLLGGLALRAQDASKPPSASEAEADEGWPRLITTPGATVLLYQPQLSRVTADDVEARAAVQVTVAGTPEPSFGAVWMTARVDINRDARLVSFRDIRVPKVRSPDGTDEDEQKLAALLERETPKWDIEMSLDQFIPLLEVADHDERAESGLRNDPPRIVVSKEPATLVVIDGEPRRQAVSEPPEAARAGLERVVNTPVALVFDPQAKAWFLAGGGDLWYAAADVLGPYTVAKTVPGPVKALAPKSDEEKTDASGEKPPGVIVSTEPTELIVVAGDPQYAPLGDTDLLSLTNSDRDVIVEMATRKHFVLLSGRWYASEKELLGPWRYVDPADLPASFARIPADSDRGHVRAQVPGTVEAQEALLDNAVPQTATTTPSRPCTTVRRDSRTWRRPRASTP